MDNEKVKQFIETQRQKGISDDKIVSFLESKGVNLSQPVKQEKSTVMEKVASFTGGEKIAQGLGQALANKEIAKQQEESLNQSMDIQTNLLKRIKEKKALGEDTSRLENALNIINENISKTGEQTGELLNQKGLTTKQVLGDALQLATTVVGAGTLPGAGKKVLASKTLTEGLKAGAKTGAITGGAFGASTGASQALEEDKSLGDVAKEALKGGILGAGTGAILGGVTGGVSGAIKGRQATKLIKQKDFVEDLVMPKQTEAIKQLALKEGRVTEQGLLNASRITPSKRDLQLADAVSDIVSNKKSPQQNIDLITNKVKDINSGVKAYVQAKKVPFNTKQLTSQLNKGKQDLDLIFASDKNAEKTYNAVMKKFVDLVKNKDTAGLLDARQDFDKIPAVKKLLESDKLGENARKEIVMAIRTQANKYVADLLPKGNKYRETLLKESRMIEAISNIIDKNTSTIGTNKLQELTKQYPILKWLVGGLATGIAGAAGVGVGSTIINSSD